MVEAMVEATVAAARAAAAMAVAVRVAAAMAVVAMVEAATAEERAVGSRSRGRAWCRPTGRCASCREPSHLYDGRSM